MNPFSSVLLDFFRPLRNLSCHARRSYFQSIVKEADNHSQTSDNYAILIRKPIPRNWVCCYEHLRFRKANPFHMFTNNNDRCVVFNRNNTVIPSNSQYIIINCQSVTSKTRYENGTKGRLQFENKWKKITHSEILFYIPKPSSLMEEPALENRQQRLQINWGNVSHRHPPLNVIIVGYDQISRLNLIRLMRETFKLLQQDADIIDLQGFNKVGDATLNNTLAFLTGMDFGATTNSSWWDHNHSSNTSYFDDCPWIWKEFEDKGYLTAYSDDGNSVLNYRFQGFKEQPTDIYMQPFSQWYTSRITRWNKLGSRYFSTLCIINRIGSKNENLLNSCYNLVIRNCIGNENAVDLLQDHARKVSKALRNHPYFHFMWNTRVSQHRGYPFLVDKSTVETLLDFNASEIRNKSVIILLSDHGWRVDKIMLSSQARVENRMPFAFLILPKWFKTEYPLAYQNIKENQYRLTTPYDIHATLRAILNPADMTDQVIQRKLDQLSKGSSANKFHRKGSSLFLPISKDRTCVGAGIDELWCACLAYKHFGINSTAALRLGKFAVDTLNSWLKPFPSCRQYTLHKIIFAEAKLPESGKPRRIIDLKFTSQIFKIGFSVTPEMNGAQFEVVIFTKPEYWVGSSSKGAIAMSTEVSRLNRYGKSECMEIYSLKKICTCIHQ